MAWVVVACLAVLYLLPLVESSQLLVWVAAATLVASAVLAVGLLCQLVSLSLQLGLCCCRNIATSHSAFGILPVTGSNGSAFQYTQSSTCL